MSKIIFKLIGNTQLYVSLFKDIFDAKKNKNFAEQFVDCEFIDDRRIAFLSEPHF